MGVDMTKSAILRQYARAHGIPVIDIIMKPLSERITQYKNLVEDARINFDATIQAIRDDIQNTLINPFCDKYRCTFWSGMGGYGFNTRNGKDLTDTEWKTTASGMSRCIEMVVVHRYRRTQAAKDLTEILKILETKGYDRDACTIGCYMNEYSPSKE
jgi:hypothetical protein